MLLNVSHIAPELVTQDLNLYDFYHWNFTYPIILACAHARSEEYKKLKEERSQVLWNAVERIIPGVEFKLSFNLFMIYY